MKKVLSLALVFLASFFLVACESKQNAEQKNIIKVGTSGAYFPFSYHEKDELKGFEVDIWRAIAKKMGYEVEFKTSKFSGLFGMLETSKIDTIANQITITNSRKQKYNFSNTYVYDGAFIIVHKDNDTINSFDDLKGKKIGVSLASNYEQILKDLNKDNLVQIIPYDGEGHKQDTIIKRIDGYVEDKTSAVAAAKEHNLPIKPVGKALLPLENAFPFLKSNENLLKKVDVAMSELEKDGTFSKISVKWFGSDITKP